MVRKCFVLRWRIQDCPGGGANSRSGCANLFFSPRKLHENERIWTHGGRVAGAPLDPSLFSTTRFRSQVVGIKGPNSAQVFSQVTYRCQNYQFSVFLLIRMNSIRSMTVEKFVVFLIHVTDSQTQQAMGKLRNM